MKYIIALGNPGNEYKDTRHNAGFIFIDAFVKEHFFGDNTWNFDKMINAFVYKTPLALFIKPDTFMNNSGETISRLLKNKLNISIDDIIVAYDDIDFNIGEFKKVFGKGTSNHNGAKSIDAALGTKDYVRIRIGIGHPGPHIPMSHYVVSKLSTDEISAIEKLASDVSILL